jgi:hypothetical protein
MLGLKSEVDISPRCALIGIVRGLVKCCVYGKLCCIRPV